MQEIEDIIAGLPKDERIILNRLRAIILDTDPHLQETISYGVPYYSHHRRVCFLWPASLIPCGYRKPVEEKVTLGLCYGNLLSNDRGLLIAENRKQVYVIRFSNVAQIDDLAVREIIQEAVLVDELFSKKKKQRTRI
jgi:uncharacterized protein YdhG (YjbR/CyaY superfamily)